MKPHGFPLLVLMLMVILSACGSADQDSTQEPGSDWRTTGIISSCGTLHMGDEELDVVLCQHEFVSNFYYDSDVQTLFCALPLPCITDDIDATAASLSLADINGDGYDDIALSCFTDGVAESAQWLWDCDAQEFVPEHINP